MDEALHITTWLLTLAVGITCLECLPAGQWGLPRRGMDGTALAIAYILGTALSPVIGPAYPLVTMAVLGSVWLVIWRISPLGIEPRQTYQSPIAPLWMRSLLIGATVAVGTTTWSPNSRWDSSGWHAMAAVMLLDCSLRWRGGSSRQRTASLAFCLICALLLKLWPSTHVQLLPIAAVAAGTVWRTRADRRAMWVFGLLIALLCSRSSTIPLGTLVALSFAVVTPKPAARLFAFVMIMALATGLSLQFASTGTVQLITTQRFDTLGTGLPIAMYALGPLAILMRIIAAINDSKSIENPAWYRDPALWLTVAILVTPTVYDPVVATWILIWSSTGGMWRVHESIK